MSFSAVISGVGFVMGALGGGGDYATRQQRAPPSSVKQVNFLPVLLACHWLALIKALAVMLGAKNESPTSICANGYFGFAPDPM